MLDSNGEGGSTYYRDRLVEAINDPEKPLFLDIQENMSEAPRGYDKETGKLKMGKLLVPWNMDHDAGGGSTFAPKGGPAGLVVISGNAVQMPNKKNGTTEVGPQDVLMHELVGHGIPRLFGTDSGNAVTNENRARSELGLELRAPNPAHTE